MLFLSHMVMSKYRKRPIQKPSPARRRTTPQSYRCEAAVVEGLEHIARAELGRQIGAAITFDRITVTTAPVGAISFTYTGGLRALLHLKTAASVFLKQSFAVPRPRALLGDEHLRRLIEQINTVRSIHPPDAFQTLYISAAGSDTTVMNRLKDTLAEQTGLTIGADDGDLMIRLRRTATESDGWEALARLSPKPLATRSWRVCNMEGALNATVARAMALLTRPDPRDVFLNIGCGSGALLIERMDCGPLRRALGCDINPEALTCARKNLDASGYGADVRLHNWDARALPIPDSSINVLCADLPFGHLVGSHKENLALYPAILDESARIAMPRAVFVIITHELRLMEQLIAQSTAWTMIDTLRVTLSGLHPCIFILQRI